MFRNKKNKNWFIVMAAVIVCFAFSPPQAGAGTWQEKAKLLASDGAGSDRFGRSVSISGDYAIVGAAYDDSGKGSAYIFERDGTNWVEQQKLTASDGAASDYFGYSVSISGDYAIVGAYGDDDKGNSSGSAYIFKRDGTSWVQQAKLLASDGAAIDDFGYSVSISGDYAIVGAYLDDDTGSSSGSAYIFKRDGTNWVQQQKLTASDGTSYDWFGYSVSISGDYAIVGAYFDNDKGTASGSAYIFKRDVASWSQQQKLTASDGAANDYFGYSVSISGDLAIVGAYYDDDKGSSSGSAYIFKRDGTNWVEQQKLTASDGAASDQFGYSVSISNDYAIVGAYGDDSGKGSAYVFKRDGTSWSEQAKLTALVGAANDWFGCSVSISGDYAIVGAYYDDDKGTDSGSAYAFAGAARAGTGWMEEQKLLASDGAINDSFGCSVSINGDYAIVGAYFDDDKGTDSGSAYIFKRDGMGWNQHAKLTASDGAAGDYFGWSVSISSDYAIVGAYGDDDNGYRSGSAYIFKRNGTNWVQQQKLTASDSAADDWFGCSVSISGDYAIVGAYQDDDNGNSSGSAYIFKRNGTNWVQQQKLTALDSAIGNCFGYSVFISGDLAIVGAEGDDDNGALSGSAYIFKWDGISWVQQAKLLASDGAAIDVFGYSVSISGNYAIVGAPRDGDRGTDSGSAYIFKWDGNSWSQQQKLLASDGAAGDWFGYSVSISGDYAIVGAPYDDDWGTNSGSADLFKWDGTCWNQQQKLTASDGAASDVFGCSVSISGDYAIVGAYYDDDKGSASGSACIFKFCPRADLDDNCKVDFADFATFAGAAWANTWLERQKLLASDGAAYDSFSYSISISGDYAIVGAQGDDGKGSAYIFKWNGTSWNQQQKLTASDGAANDFFGCSVSISGDYAIVGAYGDDDNGYSSGSAYIFKWNGTSWNQQQKLLASDGAAYDYFGYSVSISGDYAIVGAYYDDGKGSAYIFKWNGTSWVQQQKLTASDGAANDWFGYSVSISGDYAIVGAYGDDDKGGNSGSAYIFMRDGTSWSLQQKLTASDGAANDYFGVSVSISGDLAIVGAYYDDDRGVDSGSAYIFKRYGTNWVEQQKLLASDGAANDFFGYSVSISGDYAIVGAYGDGDKGSNSGSADLFKWDGTCWNQQQKLLASDGAANDLFGCSVSTSGDYAIVGAIHGNGNSGSAYAFKFCPRADLSDDCKVDLADFAIFADWWLYGTD